MNQVPTQFIENCKTLGVDKKTAIAYYSSKASGKPTSSLISHLVGSKFKTQAEANSKLFNAFKSVVSTVINTCKPLAVTPVKSDEYLTEARAFLEKSLGEFKSVKYSPKQSVKKNKIIIASDFHVPFHSAKALDTLLKEDAETLVILGDFGDLFSANRFNNDTSWISQKEEFAHMRAVAETLAKNFKKIYYIIGNHDDRVQRRMTEALPHLGIEIDIMALITTGLNNFEPLSYTVKGTKAHTRFAQDEILKQFAVLGDVALCHFDHFTGQDAAIKANQFLDTWSHILKTPNPLKVVLHGHTHRLNLNYTPTGKVLISTGCMSQPQGYQLQQAGKYTPPTVGFITLEQINGVTDVNSIRTVFIG